jgi:DNA-binding transcriptional regulator YdaS (Cro superfamily)
MDVKKNPVQKAIDAVGSLAELARRTRCKYQSIQQWRDNGGKIPPEHVLKFEVATKGAVSRHEFRPDIYPVERVAKACP